VRPTAEDLRTLAAPAAAALVFVAAGAALLWHVHASLAVAKGQLAVARAERAKAAESLARIAEEEREVREKVAVYRRLRDAGILGEERRLDWVEEIGRIRARRDLLDVRYTVERQRLLQSVPGKPAAVDFRASTMKVDLALLHEGDLLDFLADLREAGNAYVSVTGCRIERATRGPGAGGLAPRLGAKCDIDLITILDRGAKL